MKVSMRALVAAISCGFVAASLTIPAFADGQVLCGVGGCEASSKAAHARNKGDRSNGTRPSNSHTRSAAKSPKFKTPSAAELVHERGLMIKAALASYREQLSFRAVCLQGAHTERCASPNAPDFGSGPIPFAIAHTLQDPKAPPKVVLTPKEVAYIAFARLKLTAPKPGIGPSPSINRWHMAAVGYPLWLWAQGSTNPAPVSDSVGGLFVSLDARVSKIVFGMGDGSKVTCRDVGKHWGSWVAAGQPSPVCGYTYKQPSLPQGQYTITATTYWSVAWNVTGHTGVIPFVQTASTKLPVGELQVLVR